MSTSRNVLVLLAHPLADPADVPPAARATIRPGTTAVKVVAPALVSPLRSLCSDLDDARDRAATRADDAVADLRAHGITAEATVGDEDPAVAVADELALRRYDEIQVFARRDGRSWRERRLEERLAVLTDAPVRRFTVAVGRTR